MIKKIGVVGAGMMGAGIAQSALEAGFRVVIYDHKSAIADEAHVRVKKSIQNKQNKVNNRNILKNLDEYFQVVTSLDLFENCDFVVEAIVEDMDLKKKLFMELDQICKPNTILASNTSALSIAEMSNSVERKEQFAGFHFHLPVHQQHIVDVIPTEYSSTETIQTLVKLGKNLGKKVVIVKDTPGFIVNRLLFPYILDAIRMLEQGIAKRDEIDISMVLATSHPMGPLMLADFIGLDTILSVSNTLYQEIGEARLQAPDILKKMVEDGLYGMKNEKGFYNYNEPVDEADRRAKIMLEISNLLNE